MVIQVLIPFLFSSVYSYLLFLISSASGRSLPFLSFIMPILAQNVLLRSPIFWKRSLVFPILLFSSISLHCSLKKVFFSPCSSLALHSVGHIFPFLPCLLLLFLPQLFVKLPQTALPSCLEKSINLKFPISFLTYFSIWSLSLKSTHRNTNPVLIRLCISIPVIIGVMRQGGWNVDFRPLLPWYEFAVTSWLWVLGKYVHFLTGLL